MNIDQFWDKIGWRPPDSWRIPDSAKDAAKREVSRRTMYMVGGALGLVFVLVVIVSLNKKPDRVVFDFDAESITLGTLADVVERAGLGLRAGEIPKDIASLPKFPDKPEPSVKDGWNQPVLFKITDVAGKKSSKTLVVRSVGPDAVADTDDDYVVEVAVLSRVPPAWEYTDAVNRRGK